jgi:ABC-type transporter Mla MlaB component
MNEQDHSTSVDPPRDRHGDCRGSCRESGDLVVDLSGIRKLDFASLALLLTAQQQAEQEDRVVWLAGVPVQIWRNLTASGLGRFFRPFPVSGEKVA